MALFIDQLDIWLMTLGITLITSAYGVYMTFIRRPKVATDGASETVQVTRAVYVEVSRVLGIFYTAVGVYALATGVWASITWPLPSSYNLMFSDAWPMFGFVSLMIGLALALGYDVRYLSIPLMLFGIPVIVYGADILTYHLTREPTLAAGMYILLGLALLLNPGVMLTRGNVSRYMGYLVMMLLVLSGILAFVIGIPATFEHTAGWLKWAPWYGVSG
ncbi:DUF981 family protein [Vulcanisaeta thermophila]|uniref:DUF981 family protein n=1 Tax=Vulcanisaeta thermophila TaxID=867917 RepID=UPI0008537606|nr:DUF981 domain-containing protein [Vulcanisaeta thermophila]